jgi:hypothetical protein
MASHDMGREVPGWSPTSNRQLTGLSGQGCSMAVSPESQIEAPPSCSLQLSGEGSHQQRAFPFSSDLALCHARQTFASFFPTSCLSSCTSPQIALKPPVSPIYPPSLPNPFPVPVYFLSSGLSASSILTIGRSCHRQQPPSRPVIVLPLTLSSYHILLLQLRFIHPFKLSSSSSSSCSGRLSND